MKILSRLLFLLVAVMSLASCGDDDNVPAVQYPSARDGLYEGSQLKAYLDGNDITKGLSVYINSEFAYNIPNEVESSDSVIALPTSIYNSTITVKGFPGYNKKVTFQTESDYREFNGTTTINGNDYDYKGEFVGHPLLRHENQGLNIWFTTK